MAFRNLYRDLAEQVGRSIFSSQIAGGVNFENAKSLGRLIRSRRHSIGISQGELAKLAGVGRRFVSELERGKGAASLAETLLVCRAANLQLSARLENMTR